MTLQETELQRRARRMVIEMRIVGTIGAIGFLMVVVGLLFG